ncbi:hypothetical protein [Hymenobacter canadensis]|uniref:Uncharacterized protein n=1 Tax=Hymenobacter canadensis TaxID=2999067 RepID=A0ABY7LN42_9BACT|nr:hypothetical protein [Hymenobacter canadensis]WBA40313.1 hypothetical protein O3303_10770 [Hymenobacter canadensis]
MMSLRSSFSASEAKPLGRWLALTQQLKDLLSMALLGFALLFGVLVGIAIPGLVLFFVRWRLLGTTTSHATRNTIWLLTLLHELVWAAVFLSESGASEMGDTTSLGYSYALGVVVSICGLAATITTKTDVPDAA